MLQDYTLWACLAAMATYAKHLTTAEEAYAAIDEMDKVAYLQHIKVIVHNMREWCKIEIR